MDSDRNINPIIEVENEEKQNMNGKKFENIVLYLREVDQCLALVCLINESDISK